MEHSHRVWKNTLSEILNRTYLTVLTDAEINERVDYIISKKDELDPLCLYKCILYNNTQLEVGKVAVDYRLTFASDDFREAIDNGRSIEIDSLTSPFKEELEREIYNSCLIINHGMSKSILSGNISLDLEEAKNELNYAMKVELHPSRSHVWFRSSSINYMVSTNQMIYACVFNQNPFDGEVIGEEVKKHVSHHYPFHWSLFESLKSKYKSGIKLDLVRNCTFFG